MNIKNPVRKILLLTPAFFYCQFSFAQKAGFTIAQVDSIVKYIDANAMISTTASFSIKKMRSLRKPTGTGTNKYYADLSKIKLYKVVCEFNLDTHNTDQYYFWEGDLLYVSAARDIYVGELDTKTYTTQFYYQNGSLLLYRKEKAKPLFTADEYLEMGRAYLTDFKPDQQK